MHPLQEWEGYVHQAELQEALTIAARLTDLTSDISRVGPTADVITLEENYHSPKSERLSDRRCWSDLFHLVAMFSW